MSERTRKMYYIEGSTARVMEVPAKRRRPSEEVEREERRTRQNAPARSPQKNTNKEQQHKVNTAKKRHISAQSERALAFNLKYTVYVLLSVAIMMCASVIMLGMESKLTKQRQNISNLESQLQTIEDDNAAYKIRLDNMYSLDQVYDIATNELGMVYAKKGQIVYYDSANEDYVKQYKDVPSAN